MIVALLAACVGAPAESGALPELAAAQVVPPAACRPHRREASLTCEVEGEAPSGSPGWQPGDVTVIAVVAVGEAVVEADCWTTVTWPGEDCVGELGGYLDEIEAPEAPDCGCLGGERLDLVLR